jgi:hypothetical protein
MDTTATARVSQLKTAGATVSAAQAMRISNFISAEKAAGRWAGHKRIFIPGWGVAAANAIDLVTGAAGTWNGTITPAPGYFVGTGHLDVGASPATLGLTASSGGFGWLGLGVSTTGGLVGCQNGTTQILLAQWFASTGVRAGCHDLSAGIVSQGASGVEQNYGIISVQRQGGERRINRRVASGSTQIALATGADSGSVPTVNFFVGKLNDNGTPSSGSDLKYGAAFINTGFTAAADAAFTANLKTLWEGLFSLTLP